MSKVKISNKPTKSKTKNDMAEKRAKTASKPVNKKSIKDIESNTKKVVKTGGNKIKV